MTLHQLLRALKLLGCSFVLHGETYRLRVPQGDIHPGWHETVRRHKSALRQRLGTELCPKCLSLAVVKMATARERHIVGYVCIDCGWRARRRRGDRSRASGAPQLSGGDGGTERA